jgi:hypothetical protein
MFGLGVLTRSATTIAQRNSSSSSSSMMGGMVGTLSSFPMNVTNTILFPSSLVLTSVTDGRRWYVPCSISQLYVFPYHTIPSHVMLCHISIFR